jgi:hypothetical protein
MSCASICETDVTQGYHDSLPVTFVYAAVLNVVYSFQKAIFCMLIYIFLQSLSNLFKIIGRNIFVLLEG